MEGAGDKDRLGVNDVLVSAGEQTVLPALERGMTARVLSTKLCSLLPDHATKSEGVWNAGIGKSASVHLSSSPSLPIPTPSMPSREGAGLGRVWNMCRSSWKRLQV